MRSKLTDQGHITVPPALRDELGLNPGAEVELAAVDGKLVVSRPPPDRSLIEKWRGRGRLPGDMTVDEYLGIIRGHDRD